MFKKILIANRGEIACRIIRTARRMGLGTVAVYSDADRDARHVAMADEAVHIGPARAADSYLSRRNLLRAVRETGADAVHPGYGFLAENAAFARQLGRRGITFIGPRPDAIAAMGDKIRSKKLARRVGVEPVPATLRPVRDADDAVRIADAMGYPVLLKASAGGGGKGMRVARDAAECRDGLDRAVSEALASFGDGRVFVETYIENPRHIEIQVLADSHGNAVHLGERECSIQRRHQKVIEEAPSPFIDAGMRRAMGEKALALARAVRYLSAGTVEFIVDADRNFYFLEMNTRLQVEHPVTEAVTGLDLVELMIRVAAGEPLPFGQEDVTMSGWAIEARVYAEDPKRNFLPSVGRLVRYREPEASDAVRVDSGVSEGADVSVHYDPMIAKVIASGADRAAAIRALGDALDRFYIRGVDTNVAFLARVMAHDRFRAGDLGTNFIAEEFPDGGGESHGAADRSPRILSVAAVVHHARERRAGAIDGRRPSRRPRVSGDWVVINQGSHDRVRVSGDDGSYEVVSERGRSRLRTDWQPGFPLFSGELDGERLVVQVDRSGVGYRLIAGGAAYDVVVLSPRAAELYRKMPAKDVPDTSRFLLSPMPGLLVSVAVEPGQQVRTGEELAVVEAMKMENVLRADRDVTVSEIHAGPGDHLAVDQVIMEFS